MVLPREAGPRVRRRSLRGAVLHPTNRGAKNFRVVTAPMADPSEQNWKSFIEHNPARQDRRHLIFFARHIVVAEREGGLTHLRVIDMKRGSRTASPRGAGLHDVARRQPRVRHHVIRFNYQSMVTPSSVYDYDMDTRQADAAQAAPKSSAATIRRATRRSASGRRRATVSRCRSRSCTSRAWRSTARRRCCSTATAPTARPARRRSRQPSEPARSRRDLRHRLHPRRRRARRRVARARAHDEEEEHVHGLHRLRRLSRREQYTSRVRLVIQGGSAGGLLDGRGQSTCGPISSRPSSHRYRSSTSSTRCSTPRCR